MPDGWGLEDGKDLQIEGFGGQMGVGIPVGLYLYKQLQAAEECWEMEKLSFSGKSMTTGYQISNDKL